VETEEPTPSAKPAKPKGKSKRADDDEEDVPFAKRPGAAKKASKADEDDEDEDRPRKKTKSRADDDEDAEDRPRKMSKARSEDEDDDRPRRKPKANEASGSGKRLALIGGGGTALIAIGCPLPHSGRILGRRLSNYHPKWRRFLHREFGKPPPGLPRSPLVDDAHRTPLLPRTPWRG
jgi:hypothetical protein